MSDRLVRNLDPGLADEARVQPFSAYLRHPNLVLLGDPGAGKSHLFDAFSAPLPPYRARDFLNTSLDLLRLRRTLFIDGLDEKRAGRADGGTIDAIVRKLWELKPAQVRISCRAQDWLGDTDLAAFRGYFDHFGGVVVLSLEPLSRAEQVSIVSGRGIVDPGAFLKEAEHRRLHELLVNPQNLSMLADVVRKKSWPRTRAELFATAVEVLLTEHNREHAAHETGKYTPQELVGAAGEICAARLIADVDGIALTNTSISEGYPSYRTINLADSDRILCALRRRAFVTTSMLDTVDYVHRTIAEYLAARSLAAKARDGLPLGRIRALLGIDGNPASELRGLHAWLAVLLQDQAHVLIEADPFGVLSYGDAASLSKSNREHLMRALAQLSASDPWFRSGDWSASASIGALSGPDMLDSFRAILRDEAAPYVLHSLVLDALTVGAPLADLIPDLEEILLDGRRVLGERDGALDALFNAGPDGVAAVRRAYPKFSSSIDDLRLRTQALRRLAALAPIGSAEFVRLLQDAFAAPNELGGLFWNLHHAIRDDEMPGVLNEWSAAVTGKRPKTQRTISDILIVLDELLIRYLSSGATVDPVMLFGWLERRREFSDHYDYGHAERLKAALLSNTSVLSAVLDKAVLKVLDAGRSWTFRWDLSKLLVGATDDVLVLEKLLRQLDQVHDGRREVAYEAAISCCFSIGESASPTYFHLLAYADEIPSLHTVRDGCRVSKIPDWRTEQSEQRVKGKIDREANLARTRADFQLHRSQIRSGTHIGWLSWISDVYFARFRDVDARATPHERLVAQLGDENLEVALEALRTFVLNGQISTLAEIVDLHGKDRYYRWWIAVIAGLDECAEAGVDILKLPDPYLQSALAIDLLHPTYQTEGQVSHKIDHSWKHRLFEERPQLVVEAYSTLARADLAAGRTMVYGLTELMRTKAFAPHRAEIAADLLHDFPAASSLVLAELLPTAITSCSPEGILDLVRRGYATCAAGAYEEARLAWLAIGLRIRPAEFRPLVEPLGEEGRRRLVWALRDTLRLPTDDESQQASASAESLEFALALAAQTFPRAEPPDSGWNGDTNDWDATRFIQSIISRLSADVSEPATQALGRLLQDSHTKSFHNEIRHGIANQRRLRVDAEFRQPTWEAALQTLHNGAPANIADMHALALAHLQDLVPFIASSNTDHYKRFWNETSRGAPTNPKPEESARHVLVDLLRPRLAPFGVAVEPEGHMAHGKRADIAMLCPGIKVVIELKRDYHAEVWSAIGQQLERFYTRDPDARGYGIYGVFWFGEHRPSAMPHPPAPHQRPATAAAMLAILMELVPIEKRDRIVPIVIDVSGDGYDEVRRPKTLAIPRSRRSKH
jgi:hypothetical protein